MKLSQNPIVTYVKLSLKAKSWFAPLFESNSNYSNIIDQVRADNNTSTKANIAAFANANYT